MKDHRIRIVVDVDNAFRLGITSVFICWAAVMGEEKESCLGNQWLWMVIWFPVKESVLSCFFAQCGKKTRNLN